MSEPRAHIQAPEVAVPQDRPYPAVNLGLYRLARCLIGAALGLAARRHVEGLENVPCDEAFVMASNHLSYIDSPFIFVELPAVIHVLAAEKYEHHLIFGPILRIAGAVFIRRGEVDRPALRQALAVLRDGNMLGMAVEGTRSRTGALSWGKTGTAYLATRAGVPILPVVVWGTEGLLRNLRRLRRTDVYMRIGPPFRLPSGRASSADLDRYTDEIMCTLAAMLPEQYRGVYADHPLTGQKLADG
jgi:1-acyl-sn-glycerol-3-phosphate acyltransferase